MPDGDYLKVFKTVQLRKSGDKLLLQENPRLLPGRILGSIAVIVVAGAAAAYLLLFRNGDNGVLSGAFELLSLILLAICGITIVSLGQLLVFARFPITIDRATKEVSRGSRVHLAGKFRAEKKRLAPGDGPSAFHVRLAQKDKAMFLWRAENEQDADEMVNLVNEYLGVSLPNAKVREDSFDHVG